MDKKSSCGLIQSIIYQLTPDSLIKPDDKHFRINTFATTLASVSSLLKSSDNKLVSLFDLLTLFDDVSIKTSWSLMMIYCVHHDGIREMSDKNFEPHDYYLLRLEEGVYSSPEGSFQIFNKQFFTRGGKSYDFSYFPGNDATSAFLKSNLKQGNFGFKQKGKFQDEPMEPIIQSYVSMNIENIEHFNAFLKNKKLDKTIYQCSYYLVYSDYEKQLGYVFKNLVTKKQLNEHFIFDPDLHSLFEYLNRVFSSILNAWENEDYQHTMLNYANSPSNNKVLTGEEIIHNVLFLNTQTPEGWKRVSLLELTLLRIAFNGLIFH